MRAWQTIADQAGGRVKLTDAKFPEDEKEIRRLRSAPSELNRLR